VTAGAVRRLVVLLSPEWREELAERLRATQDRWELVDLEDKSRDAVAPAAIIVDPVLLRGEAHEWIARAREWARGSIIVTVRRDASPSLVVEDLRAGATDVVSRRDDLAHVALLISTQAIRPSDPRAHDCSDLRSILGESRQIEAVRDAILSFRDRAFKSVLVVGETGVGKELAARAIRSCSPWREGPFEALSAAAVPSDHMESELFGTARGAFTGSIERSGIVERANGGVLFLDEVNSMSLAHQAKVLRFLDGGSARRLGSSGTYTVELGILCAAQEDILARIESGEFRDDLYYRLIQDGIVRIPPLRERGSDVVLLAQEFLQQLGRYELSRGARTVLGEYRWPGNVRELRAVVQRVARLTAHGVVSGQTMCAAIDEVRRDRGELRHDRGQLRNPVSPVVADCAFEKGICFEEATRTFQRRLLMEAYQAVDGNLTEAGILLGLHRRQGEIEGEEGDGGGEEEGAGEDTGSIDRRARKLAHRRFSYWYHRLVVPNASTQEA
jgi:DNA-binding NtrC family response regulator